MLRRITFTQGGTFASICSLGVSAYLLINDPQQPFWASLALIIAIAIMITAFIAAQREFKQILADAEKGLQNLTAVMSGCLHKAAHDLRDGTTKLLYKRNSINQDGLETESQGTGRSVCNHVSKILTLQLKTEVTVTLKIIKEIEGIEYAITLARSENHAPGRVIGDQHPVDERNTAFFEIRHGKKIYFSDSDLVLDQQEKRYSNTK